MDEIRAKAKNMMTDPARNRRSDPGNPDVCPVFDCHKLFPDDTARRLRSVNHDCRTAEIGCVECKGLMADALIEWIEPVQARRREFERNPRWCWTFWMPGQNRRSKIASATMKRVREAVFDWDDARKKAGAAAAGDSVGGYFAGLVRCVGS